MNQSPDITLNSSITIPQLGYGVFQVPNDESERAVLTALELGYRHLDTAAIYGNEEGVGRAIAASGIAREDLFVTTKLWNADQGEGTRAGLEDSLSTLGLDHVDLYLIHWPTPARGLYTQTWRMFEEFLAEGTARAIGVSNFQPAHLDALALESDVVPAVNQVELHPLLQQREVRADAARRGIVVQAWSPLGQGTLLGHPELVAIAARHGKSVAQIILRWHIEQGHVVLSKSVTPERMRENAEIFDFALTDIDLAAIDALDAGGRVGPDPDQFN